MFTEQVLCKSRSALNDTSFFGVYQKDLGMKDFLSHTEGITLSIVSGLGVINPCDPTIDTAYVTGYSMNECGSLRFEIKRKLFQTRCDVNTAQTGRRRDVT